MDDNLSCAKEKRLNDHFNKSRRYYMLFIHNSLSVYVSLEHEVEILPDERDRFSVNENNAIFLRC